MSFFSALEKAGLVKSGTPPAPPPSATDIDDGELEKLLAAVNSTKRPPRKVVATSNIPPTEPVAQEQVRVEVAEEELAFADLYERAGVHTSPYPIEKLAKLLDGLGAMAPEVRKQAVMALDAADDTWQISDPIKDALAKIGALNGSRDRLGRTIADAEAQATTEIRAQDEYLSAAVKELQSQINELNQKLSEETQSVAQAKVAIQSKLTQKKATCVARQAELDGEVASFQRLALMFGANR